MHRSARVLAAVLALSLTGCDHRSGHHQAALPRAPSPYTPRAVQRAFARAGVPLARDIGMETFVRTSGHGSNFAALFTDSIGDVQVTVRRREATSSYVIIGSMSATKTQGNVEVDYPKRGPQARRVLRALALLRKARLHASARLPTLLADGPRGRAYTWQVRPAQITYTGDGSGVLGGSGGTGAAHPGHLKWARWTRAEATGSGTVWIDDCNPDCAEGTFTGHGVKVNAFRPVKAHFTRLTLRYTYHGKRHIDRRGIWHTGGIWSYYIVGR